MNSLQQYIDLYRQHEQTVRGESAPVMNRNRARALSVLEHGHLPRSGRDGYAWTDLEEMFAPDYGVNITRLPFRADVASAFRCGVPHISTLTGIVANDVFGPSEGLLRNCPQGVTVCAFSRATGAAKEALEKYYGNIASPLRPETALNSLLAQDGVLVHISDGVKLERPIQLVNILGGVNTPLLALRRLLVVVEKDASAKLLVCDHSTPGISACSNTVVEIHIDSDAHLEYYDLEETSGTSRYMSLSARLLDGAHLHSGFYTLSCGTSRNDVDIHLDGKSAECTVNGMTIAGDGQSADTSVVLNHHKPRCHSHQLFKYALFNGAHGAFEGLIRIDPNADHTVAAQTNRNLLEGPQARMHTRPQLEIYCDDVQANHGAATGQLDNDALFYMRTRGIPLEQARNMLMQAFMADVVDAISLNPLRDRMRALVENRLGNGNNPAACPPDCTTCAPH